MTKRRNAAGLLALALVLAMLGGCSDLVGLGDDSDSDSDGTSAAQGQGG